MTNTTKEVRANKDRILDDFRLGTMVWHLVRRHAVFLLILSNVLTLTGWLVLNAQTAVTNLVK